MGAWGPDIFSDDLASDIRREYTFMLSIGIEDEAIEKILEKYYSEVFDCSDPDEDVFWFALAMCEWKYGRLSPRVKEKALFALEQGCDLERWNSIDNQKNYIKRIAVLEKFKKTILSPMPPARRPKKRSVRHCPWKVGSLLAYRIVSNKKNLSNHPCFNKYALLRVIKINRHPLSKILPDERYDESMLVGLYNWIGDEIPNPDIVKELEFIPIEEFSLPKPVNDVDYSILDILPEERRNKLKADFMRLFEKRIETCASLDWVPTKNEVADITYLDCDESFQDKIPDFFDVSICSYALTHFLPFDITLSKRLEKYLK